MRWIHHSHKWTDLHVLDFFDRLSTMDALEMAVDPMQNDIQATTFGICVGIGAGDLLFRARSPVRSFIAV
jgi:hypothetical protein